MAVTVTHATVAVGTDDGNGEIAKAQWNEGHSISMASQRVLGRTTAGTGAAEELKGMWVEVSRATASNSATVDFTGIDSTSDEWMVVFSSVKPVSDGELLEFRTSTDGGSTWDTGASYYSESELNVSSSGEVGTVSQIATNGRLGASFNGVSNSTNAIGCNGFIVLDMPSVAKYCMMRYEVYISEFSTNDPAASFGHVLRNAAADVNGIRFYMTSTNIDSGTFVLYKRLK
jgi:hypothetical protein